MTALAAVAAAPALAVAQDMCLPYAAAAKHLQSKFAELPTGVGMTSDGQLVQLFRSETGDTWTLVLVSPDGTTCALAEGESWTQTPLLPGRSS